MPTEVDPRAVHAPEAYEALRRLEADVRATVPAELLDAAQARVAISLGQAPWSSPGDDPVLTFADQFVIDVTAVDVSAILGRLGEGVGPFVQGLWLLDLGMRTDIAVAKLFGELPPPRALPEPTDLAASFDEFLRAVARMRYLDPVTSELVRLRGARFHNCRLCKSLRTASAIRAGADEETFGKIDRYESSDLDERAKVALRLTDAIVTQPAHMDAALVAQAHAHLSEPEIVELVLDVMRNAANKVAVAFGADEPHVAEGIELYDVLADGNLVYGLTDVGS
jgi:alkylhydroperoxidase family enzyme